MVDGGNLPNVAYEVRDLLADSGKLFDRGLPVRLVTPADGGVPSAAPLNQERVVIEAHRVCRPVKMNKDGNHVPVTLSTRVANLYLALDGDWKLAPLSGISTAPVLTDDGGIRAANGYDTATQLYCVSAALPNVPERPSACEAGDALALLRWTFRTFAFADAVRVTPPGETVISIVDVDPRIPPGAQTKAPSLALAADRRVPAFAYGSRPGVTHPRSPAFIWRRHRQGPAGPRRSAPSPTAFTRAPSTAGNSSPEELDEAAHCQSSSAAQPVLFLDNGLQRHRRCAPTSLASRHHRAAGLWRGLLAQQSRRWSS